MEKEEEKASEFNNARDKICKLMFAFKLNGLMAEER